MDLHLVADVFISGEMSVEELSKGTVNEVKLKEVFAKCFSKKITSISAMKQGLLNAYSKIIAGDSQCHKVIHFNGSSKLHKNRICLLFIILKYFYIKIVFKKKNFKMLKER